jgi:hypothetical protein
MRYNNWSPLLATPGHPGFPAAHAVNGAALPLMLADVFGSNFNFTLKTYGYIGLPDRKHNRLTNWVRRWPTHGFFWGIHYQPSCHKGLIMGKNWLLMFWANLSF